MGIHKADTIDGNNNGTLLLPSSCSAGGRQVSVIFCCILLPAFLHILIKLSAGFEVLVLRYQFSLPLL